jgi:uncharacterized tellurite resistance protein B-like protein
MSLIDKVLHAQPGQARELTPAEAATTLLVAAISADGTLAPAENARLNGLLASMQLYRQVPKEQLQAMVERAIAFVAHADPDAMLAECASAIPDDLRAPIFALAVELVFADGAIAEREKGFVDAVQAALAIDDGTAMKIVDVLLLKMRA